MRENAEMDEDGLQEFRDLIRARLAELADGMPTASTRPTPGLGADNAAVRARVARGHDRT